MKQLQQIQQRLIIRRYSPSTVNTYLSCLKNFFTYYNLQKTEELSKEELLVYLEHLVKKGYSKSAQNQHINAIKFYYEKFEIKIVIDSKFNQSNQSYANKNIHRHRTFIFSRLP